MIDSFACFGNRPTILNGNQFATFKWNIARPPQFWLHELANHMKTVFFPVDLHNPPSTIAGGTAQRLIGIGKFLIQMVCVAVDVAFSIAFYFRTIESATDLSRLG